MFNIFVKVTGFICLVLFSSIAYSAKINVFVSILPQQYIVERIGGEYVSVNVMVKPGQSPETFEPSPKLMSLYSKSDVYFTIGLPFEQVWIERVTSLNDDVSIVKTQLANQQLIKKMNKHGSHKLDPHTWLSPLLFLQQAKFVLDKLSELSPENKNKYLSNYNKLSDEVNSLHEYNSSLFKNNQNNKFVTFHPAFSYFSLQYGLTQISIEIEGKEPSAKQIARVINQIKNENVRYILIEKQFNQVIPKTIAESVGAELLVLDPLALDYLVNLKDIADKINRALF